MMNVESFKEFVDLVEQAKDRQELEDLLVAVTTPNERNDLVRRVQVVQRLLRDAAHHDIANSMSVGVATVTRGANELKAGRFKILKRLHEADNA